MIVGRTHLFEKNLQARLCNFKTEKTQIDPNLQKGVFEQRYTLFLRLQDICKYIYSYCVFRKDMTLMLHSKQGPIYQAGKQNLVIYLARFSKNRGEFKSFFTKFSALVDHIPDRYQFDWIRFRFEKDV